MPRLTLLVTVLLCTIVSGAPAPTYPSLDADPAIATRRGSDVVSAHGTTLPDPYRWLEDIASEDTRTWVTEQDTLFRGEVDALTAGSLLSRVERFAVDGRYGAPVSRNGQLYFMSFAANGMTNRQVMAVPDTGGEPRLLLGAEQAAPDDAILGFSASGDGRYIAYLTGRRASRWLRLRIWDVAANRRLADTLAGVHTSMPVIAWGPDGRHFYYGRFPEPTPDQEMSAPVAGQSLMIHRLGTDQAQDVVVLGPGSEPTRSFLPWISEDGQHLVVRSAVGSEPRSRLLHASPGARTTPVEMATGADAQFAVIGADGSRLIVQTDAGAPRHRIVSLDPRRPRAACWREVVPEPPPGERIVYANVVAERLIVFRLRDAEPHVTVHDLDGTFQREIALPPLATVWGPGGGGAGFAGRRADPDAFFVTTSFADPGTVYRLNPRTGAIRAVMAPRTAFDPADFTGSRVFYTSKDGTRVPMFIARRRDTPLDGTRPVLMYGYGALGWSAFPWFQPQVLAWLDAGGIYALPCVRGGGEYGEAWHQAARAERRQTAIDDYIAAAEWLVREKYARPGQVVANGGSLSGFLAAAAVLQRPDAFGAALVDIPVLDLLRYDRVTGAAAWIGEIGSPADARQFAFLKTLSPYHAVGDRRCVPPTLVTAGERDQTAAPWHAYKYVAALQHAQTCDKPVRLQVAWGAGHTFGVDARGSQQTWARQLAFLERALELNMWRSSAGVQPPPALPRCDAPGHRQFDFWIGEWDVRPANAPQSAPMSNVITSAHGGCVIVENWTGAQMTGQSLNIFDRSRDKWHQTWADSTGSLHEYWGSLRSDGVMAFEGELPPRSAAGPRIPTKLTFFRLGPDKVRQLSEQSTDGGKTWTVAYDLIYTRRAAKKE